MSDGEIIEVATADLGPGPMVRGASALDLDHIERMLPFVDDLPLIHVRMVAGGYEILDGHHRHAVHERLKRDTMRAVVLELDDLEAFAYAAKVNGQHGAGLDLKARRQNATYLLKRSDWSDREIARCTVLSPSTVAKIRATLGSTARNGQLADKRTGSDGVQRPANNDAARAQREAIAKLLVGSDLDGNAIAKKLGCSVTTVRSVRAELEQLAQASDGSSSLSDEPEGSVPAPPAEFPGKAGAGETDAAATGCTDGDTPPSGAEGDGTGPSPSGPVTLPSDWRDRLACAVYFARLDPGLLRPVLDDDDRADLEALRDHLNAVLNQEPTP